MTSALRSSAATEQRVHEASGWRLASAKYSCRRSERNLWARSSIVIRGPRGRVAKRAPASGSSDASASARGINSTAVPMATEQLCNAAKEKLTQAYRKTQTPNYLL